MENIYLLHAYSYNGGTLICYVCYVHIPDSSHFIGGVIIVATLFVYVKLWTYIFFFFASMRIYLFILHKKRLQNEGACVLPYVLLQHIVGSER